MFKSEIGLRSLYAAKDGSWDLLAELGLGQPGAEVLFGEVAANATHSTRTNLSIALQNVIYGTTSEGDTIFS